MIFFVVVNHLMSQKLQNTYQNTLHSVHFHCVKCLVVLCTLRHGAKTTFFGAFFWHADSRIFSGWRARATQLSMPSAFPWTMTVFRTLLNLNHASIHPLHGFFSGLELLRLIFSRMNYVHFYRKVSNMMTKTTTAIIFPSFSITWCPIKSYNIQRHSLECALDRM
jgi:hypothetical protein